MKTTMEMVFEKFDKMPEDVFLTYLKVNKAGIIEKEKEQIMMAFNDGKVNSVLKKRNSNEYYNETYNQNK